MEKEQKADNQERLSVPEAIVGGIIVVGLVATVVGFVFDSEIAWSIAQWVFFPPFALFALFVVIGPIVALFALFIGPPIVAIIVIVRTVTYIANKRNIGKIATRVASSLYWSGLPFLILSIPSFPVDDIIFQIAHIIFALALVASMVSYIAKKAWFSAIGCGVAAFIGFALFFAFHL